MAKKAASTPKKVIPAVDTQKMYSLEEAISLVKQTSKTKFAGSVDVDILLNLSEKQKKETLSGSVVLPHQVGESARVAVLAEGEDQARARKAKADIVGLEDLIKDISGGKIDFDILIATPSVMRHMAKLGKVLGPRGLMPNPKNETVTTNLEKVIESYKAGKLNFKSTEQMTVRSRIAKVDMEDSAVAENFTAFVKAVFAEAKKFGTQPFKKITLSPTMGAGIKVDINSLGAL